MILNREQFDLFEKVTLGRVIFNPPFKVNSAMQEEARFVYVVNGKSRIYSANHHVTMQTGESIVMKCDNFVNNWLETGDENPNELIIIHFYPEILKEIYEGNVPRVFTTKSTIQADPVEKIPPNKMLESFVMGLRDYFENKMYISEDLLKLKLKELILILVNSDNTGRVKSILSSLFQSNEYEFKEIIHSHLYDDLSIQDLAFFSGLSLSSFKRKFKSVFGTSPVQYIKSKRLQKAKSMLEKTTERITDIAYDCGFNDVGYFSKTFAAVYNHSPSEYRKLHLG